MLGLDPLLAAAGKHPGLVFVVSLYRILITHGTPPA
jgi:hypothetical protein